MRRIVSIIVLTLLLFSMLTLTLNVQPVESDSEAQLVLETDKPVYKLGENVTTTLTNISNETVSWVGRWPVPWDIFTYPENRCVFAALPCFCVFELAAGENVTYTWNQSDGFTLGPVEAGMYEVRDNQAWGLSTFFRIVDTEIIVPDDYLTIQDAINAANDGDTIFVRNGTYYEHVVVNKSVSLLGENRETTVIDGAPITPELDYIVIFVKDMVNVNISGFTVRNGPAGIELDGSRNCTITDNRVATNYGDGITFFSSSYNTIEKNIIELNEAFGIDLVWSDNNSVVRNDILSNFRGIQLQDAYGNVIFHNNLIDNLYQATSSQGSIDVWDNGCEGNYWSNYNGDDNDNDGIGDTPYVIDGSNVDHYPLMNPYWDIGDINHDLKVDIFDIVTCAVAYGSTPSDSNWNSHCDIAEPYGVIDLFDIVMIAGSYGKEYS